MSIPHLRLPDTVLLLIDFQPRLLASMPDGRTAVLRGATLAECAKLLGMEVLATEQVPDKFGGTVDELMPHVDRTFAKTRFSGWVPEVVEAVGERPVLIAGVEAHVCLLQTVLDARTAGVPVFVAADAVTAGETSQVAPALRRMTAAGAIETGVVSALYELMGDATHPAFRDVLTMVKRLLAAK